MIHHAIFIWIWRDCPDGDLDFNEILGLAHALAVLAKDLDTMRQPNSRNPEGAKRS